LQFIQETIKFQSKFIKDIELKMPYCKIVVSGDYEYNSKKAGNYIIISI